MIYAGGSIRSHGYGVDFARSFTRALKIMYGAVLTGAGASSALNAFALIYMRMLMGVYDYGSAFA